MTSVEDICKAARTAATALASTPTNVRNGALEEIRKQLEGHRDVIEKANKEDKQVGIQDLQNNLISESLHSRLDCEGKKFDAMLRNVDSVKNLPDILGQCDLARQLDEGLCMYRVKCPIGVLVIIYEARPEAAVQIASLALKSGNALILKGGKEAKRTNTAIFEAISAALAKLPNVPNKCVQILETRDEIDEVLHMESHVDLIIPRGSNELVRRIKANTKIPVLGHADGICSIYVDANCDIKLAVKVISDSKTQYPAACNATEMLLVNKNVPNSFYEELDRQMKEKGVTLKVDSCCIDKFKSCNTVLATEEDFKTEFLCLEMAVRCVSGVSEAMCIINTHGSHHTDCIITQDNLVVEEFMNGVDSAGVYHNCSTRFADGYRYGFGAEVGISTNRIHARGPVGMEGLMIYKYRIYGKGHTAEEFNKRQEKCNNVCKEICVDSCKDISVIANLQNK